MKVGLLYSAIQAMKTISLQGPSPTRSPERPEGPGNECDYSGGNANVLIYVPLLVSISS